MNVAVGLPRTLRKWQENQEKGFIRVGQRSEIVLIVKNGSSSVKLHWRQNGGALKSCQLNPCREPGSHNLGREPEKIVVILVICNGLALVCMLCAARCYGWMYVGIDGELLVLMAARVAGALSKCACLLL